MLRALTPTSPHAPLRGRLPLPDPRRWLPYNRSLLQALIFLQTCTFSAFAAPSCGDSASVQTRGQLETGRDGIPPLLLRRGAGTGSSRLAAPRRQAVPWARTTSPAASGATRGGDAKSTTATGTARTGQATVGAAARGTPGTAALLCSACDQPACLSITY